MERQVILPTELSIMGWVLSDEPRHENGSSHSSFSSTSSLSGLEGTSTLIEHGAYTPGVSPAALTLTQSIPTDS